MDKFERRRLALKRLTDGIGRGGIARVAKAIGREANYVSRMLYPKGKEGRKNIGDDLIDAIENAYPGWLDDDAEIKGFTPVQKRTDIVTISRYDTGGAMGNGVVLYDQPGVIESWEVTKNWIRENVRGHTSAENLCIVTGLGDSMRPMFNPGDPLLVDRGVKTVPYESPYFFRIGDAAYVKRLQRVPMPGGGMMYRAISENPAYPPIEITDDMDFEVFGRVVQVWRREDF